MTVSNVIAIGNQRDLVRHCEWLLAGALAGNIVGCAVTATLRDGGYAELTFVDPDDGNLCTLIGAAQVTNARLLARVEGAYTPYGGLADNVR